MKKYLNCSNALIGATPSPETPHLGDWKIFWSRWDFGTGTVWHVPHASHAGGYYLSEADKALLGAGIVPIDTGVPFGELPIPPWVIVRGDDPYAGMFPLAGTMDEVEEWISSFVARLDRFRGRPCTCGSGRPWEVCGSGSPYCG